MSLSIVLALTVAGLSGTLLWMAREKGGPGADANQQARAHVTVTNCHHLAGLSSEIGVRTESCLLPSGYLGLFYLAWKEDPATIKLARQRVVAYLPGLKRDWATALAVYVVGHEWGHASGHLDELGADRFARRNWWGVVRRLGGDRTDAWELWKIFRQVEHVAPLVVRDDWLHPGEGP